LPILTQRIEGDEPLDGGHRLLPFSICVQLFGEARQHTAGARLQAIALHLQPLVEALLLDDQAVEKLAPIKLRRPRESLSPRRIGERCELQRINRARAGRKPHRGRVRIEDAAAAKILA
jgi:hypothetical protein